MGKHWQDLVRSRAKVENDVDGMSQREREAEAGDRDRGSPAKNS